MQAKARLFSSPISRGETDSGFLAFPVSGCATLDPFIGDGGAFKVITRDEKVIRYGVELDAYRVKQPRAAAEHVIHGDALDVHCLVESLSLLYLNPPYDLECEKSQNRRLERVFREHCYRWLKASGVLMVLPGDRLAVCGRVLALHVKDKKAYRLRFAGLCEVPVD